MNDHAGQRETKRVSPKRSKRVEPMKIYFLPRTAQRKEADTERKSVKKATNGVSQRSKKRGADDDQ